VQLIKQSGFKINTLNYFLQHEDVTGKASPSTDSILSLAKTLKDGLVGIEQDYMVEDDPTGEIAKSKMALVYENAVVDNFFGLLKGTTSYSVDYNHPQPELEKELKDIRYLFSIGAEFEDDLNNGIIMEQLRDKFKNEGFPIDENAEVTKENGDNWVITDKKIYIVKKEEGTLNIYDITDKIAYDHFQKRLIYQGVMTDGAKTKFENAASATEDFKDAIQKLYDMAQYDFRDLFDKYPDLKVLYDSYVASNKPETEKIADILESFLPPLKKKLKHLFIKQTLSSSVNVELSLLNELLEKPKILHSIGKDDQPAIADFFKLEVNGVSAQYFFADNTSTTPDITLSGIAFNRGTAAKSDFLNNDLVSKLLNNEIIKEVVNYTDHVHFSDTIKEESQLKGRLEELDINSDEIEPVLDIWRQTDNNLPANPAGADAKISAIWKFYLEVPVNGNYNYYIETDSGAEVKITIDENVIPINEILLNDDHDNDIWQNQNAIELKAGRLYRVELEIAKVKDKAVLKWESKGIGKESIPVKYLYPYEQVRNFSDMYIRLLKSIGILERLGLEEKEIAFFCTALSFQIDSKGFMNAIPVTPNPDGNKLEALFTILLDLLRYDELKKSLKVNDETLVRILNDPVVKAENGESLLLKVTGWDESSYKALLSRFDWDQANLSDLNKFRRLNEAFEVVNKFGVPAANLLNGTTNQPVADTVRDIQNTLRAKYDESVWLTALQPINDQLRSRQRDALVSYILHEMQKNPATENINTPDKLFEYFFIDVEMDPCMKTSRIKQANSTIQLFIQRCLMNLEPKVSPASIKADQWEWMKRYRVWEANRKIFLYPENWLEPELRDNKSSFFMDLESELLQADITDDLAETALLNYLEKLDDVSKLEISAMYLQENEADNESDDILHVFGRTTGASRKYYYRRFDGNWTPWEKVDLDIEDNPILPVVWNDRLFLFWLNIIRKGPEDNTLREDVLHLPGGGTGTPLTELTTANINEGMIEKIEINLSWSEYFNNKWQPRKTSDFNSPIKLLKDRKKNIDFEPGEFKREDIKISSYFDYSGLVVRIPYPSDYHFFKLFNKHSAPLKDSGAMPSYELYSRTFIGLNKLLIKYVDYNYPSQRTFEHEVLKKKNHRFDIVETNHYVTNLFEAPFFYQDKKHVFFVKPEESRTTRPEIPYLGTYTPDNRIPDIAIERVWERPDVVEGPLVTEPRVAAVGIRPIDTRPIDLLDKTVSVNRVVLDNRVVTFGDARIGPMGSQHARLRYDNKIGKSNFEMLNIKGVLK
jgi:hypothetical protein